jgi:high affinity sulfate transporter 1
MGIPFPSKNMSRTLTSRLAEVVPALGWLKSYQPAWLRADLVAGVTLAAYLIPAGIGDASLAGLPPSAGLYACLFAGLVFWLFTSSKQTSVTVTSAISLLVGATLAPLSDGDPARHATLAAATAIMVGALAFIARLCRAGVIVNFISESVLTGFKCGVALHLSVSQLPKLFGFHGSHGEFTDRLRQLIRHIGETNPLSLIVGGVALVLLLAGKKYIPRVPWALVVVTGGLLLGAFGGLGAHGVSMLGEVPQGLPRFGPQHLQWSDINMLLPLAMACFLLGAVETSAIGRMFACKHGYRLKPDQEFLALAGANLCAGLGQGFPTSGGMSQSLVNESSGAKTPLSGFIASLVILIVALYLSGLLRVLPQPVLAAIVLAAVTGLFKIDALRQMWAFSRSEFAVAMTALFGVLASGLLMGVLIGAILSLLLLLRRAMRPLSTELGRVPGTQYFADAIRHPVNERVPGVFIFRSNGALLYFNTEHVRDRFFELLDARGPGIKTAVYFLGTVPVVDMAGAELIAELHETLHERGIDLRLAEAHSEVRGALRRAGFEKLHGPILPDQTVEAILKTTPSTLRGGG